MPEFPKNFDFSSEVQLEVSSGLSKKELAGFMARHPFFSGKYENVLGKTPENLEVLFRDIFDKYKFRPECLQLVCLYIPDFLQEILRIYTQQIVNLYEKNNKKEKLYELLRMTSLNILELLTVNITEEEFLEQVARPAFHREDNE